MAFMYNPHKIEIPRVVRSASPNPSFVTEHPAHLPSLAAHDVHGLPTYVTCDLHGTCLDCCARSCRGDKSDCQLRSKGC